MEDIIDIIVTETTNLIEITSQPTDEVIDVNIIDNREDITLNVTPSLVEININSLTGNFGVEWGDITGTLSDQTDLQDALDLKADLVDGKVPSSQLPSYVDDVVEVANYASLPTTGEVGKIYITLDTNFIYRWTGSTYVEIKDSSAVWGAITGTLSNQIDLQNALNAKEPTIVAGTTLQYWRGDKSWQTLNTTIVPEGTNLYFTDTRARTALSASSPLTYNSGTGAFGIQQANGSQNGYLSSTDWTTFNSKQAALSGNGFVKSTGGTISYDTNTYLTTSAAASTYLALAGGTMTGVLFGTSASFSGYVGFGGNTSPLAAIDVTGAGIFSSSVTATRLILSGGTSPTGLYFGHTDKVVLANYTVGGGIDFETNGGNITMQLSSAGVLSTTGGASFSGALSGTSATFSGAITSTGNAATSTAHIFNNATGASGTAQWYADFTAGATVIGRILRGNGASGYEANGLNIDNFAGMQVKLNALGGSGGTFAVTGGAATFSSSVTIVGNDLDLSNGTTLHRITNDNTNLLIRADYGNTSANSTIQFSVDGGEKMRITSSGNVGIGTTSPSQKLVVDGGASDFTPIFAKSSLLSGGKYYGSLLAGYQNDVSKSAQFGYVYDTSNITNSFAHITPIGSSEGSKFMVRADGNVGIGTTSPATNMHLASAGMTLSATTTYSSSTTKGITLEATTGSTDVGTGIWFNNGQLYSGIAGARSNSSNWGTDLRFFTHPDSTTNQYDLTERMRITSAGNVGIGTSSPNRTLHVVGGIELTSDFVSTKGGTTFRLGYEAYTSTGGVNLFTESAVPLVLGTSSTERMRITSSGEVLIGSTSTFGSAYRLQVQGSADTGIYIGSSASAYTSVLYMNSAGAGAASIFTNRILYVTANTNGVYLPTNGVAWIANSDERLKTDLTPIENAINKVSSLRSVIGRYKTDEIGTKRSFLIAQDVLEVLPEAVTTNPKTGNLGVAYSDVIPLLVASIKELKAELDTLKNK